jgi:methionyl-tRNA formyltransferase
MDDAQRQKVTDFRQPLDSVSAFRRRTGKIGEITGITAESFKVTAQGGAIEVLKAKFEDGKKLGAGELAQTADIKAGTMLGS